MVSIKKWCSSVRKNEKYASFNHNPSNAYTSTVTENLIAALKAHKIELIAVSTPDDDCIDPSLALGSRCGIAYTNVIEPYELAAKLSNSDLSSKDFVEPEYTTTYPTFTAKEARLLNNTKNHQLLEIAHHARAKYPDALIEMHYFDDVKELCALVQEITLDSLPENMSISSFLHSAHKDIRADLNHPIARISTIPVPVIIESVAWYKKLYDYIFNACITKPLIPELPQPANKPTKNVIEVFTRGTSSAAIQKKLGSTTVVFDAEISEETKANMAVWGDYQRQLDGEYSISRFTITDIDEDSNLDPQSLRMRVGG